MAILESYLKGTFNLSWHKYQKYLNIHIYFYSINKSQDMKLTSVCLS